MAVVDLVPLVASDVTMECRALRHAMERMPAGPPGWKAPPGWKVAYKILHLRCMRCSTWRHIAIDYLGQQLYVKYEWPEGYLRGKGEGRLDANELRLWQARQSRRRRRR